MLMGIDTCSTGAVSVFGGVCSSPAEGGISSVVP
jgi:hypothetical protein